jgi:hypothetical protein
MAPPKRKRLTLSGKKQRIPKTQAFLNFLSADDAKAWLEEITETGYTKFINDVHITSSISLDQIISATSITRYDGEEFFKFFGKYLILLIVVGPYFKKWMECKIRETDVRNRVKHHHQTWICRNTLQYHQ